MSKETFSAGQTREFYGDGDFFRLLQTVGPITVEFFYQGREVAEMEDIEAGYAESFAREQKRFDRIRITSPTAQDVKWVTREGSDVRYDRGAASITGSVDLNAATIEQIRPRPEAATGSYASITPLAANTPDVVFTPAANANGAIIYTAQMDSINGSAYPTASLIAKSSAPATVIDGEVFGMTSTDGANPRGSFHLFTPQFVPAGKGLYFISTNAETQAMRACRYKLL